MSDEKYLFLDLPPFRDTTDYFDCLVGDQPLYMVVYINENQEPIMFMERSPLKGRPDTCRVFFRRDDIRAYIQTVAHDRNIPEESLRAWESNFSNLSGFIPRLDTTVKEKGRAGVHVVGTVLHRNEFKTIDVFWTSTPEFMV